MMQARSGEQGFTLIELLVSLALLALMTVYTVHAFTAMQDMSRVADDMARDQEIDAALRHVRDAISDARTVFQPDGRGGQILLFEGGSMSLTFVTVSTGERERGGLHVVTLGLEGGGELVERRRLLGNGTEDAETRTRLLSGVIALDFQYGSWDTNGKIRQEASWAIANELPVAIEFHLSVEQGDRERTVLVALRLSEP